MKDGNGRGGHKNKKAANVARRNAEMRDGVPGL